MRRALIAGTAGVLVMAGVAACGSSGPTYFLGTSSTAVLLVEWGPVSGDVASGTVTYDDLTGAAPDSSVGLDNTPMTIIFHGWSVRRIGIVDGGAQDTKRRVTIRLSALYDVFGQSSIPGMLSGDTLTLNPPPDASTGLLSAKVLKPASSQQYNAAVGKLQNEVTNENNTAASQQTAARQARQGAHDELALSQAVTALHNDVATLAREVTTAGSDVAQADTDLGTLESDAAGSQGPYCDNAYTVNDDAYTVNDDGYTMSDDVGTVEDDITGVNAAIKKVQSDVTAVHNDRGTVPKDAGTTVSDALSAVSDAASTVNADVDTVNGYLQTAYSDASGNAGTCGGPGSPTLVSGISS
jgi:hypothetical protein